MFESYWGRANRLRQRLVFDRIKAMSRALIAFCHRFYADFVMPSRLKAYRALLSSALEHGYLIVSLAQFSSTIGRDEFTSDQKHLILRHDIDTDLRTTRTMWEIEHSLGIAGSYYFRLSTIDIGLMQLIAAAGAEVGYHYEEIATVAKEKRLKTKEAVHEEMPNIAALFERNLLTLRRQTALPIDTVASHGDFVNRRLGIPNHEILKDMRLRERLGIKFEAYDKEIVRHMQSRHRDTHYPAFWVMHDDPALAISRHIKVIHVLVHPRHWCSSILVNMADDLRRLGEALHYSLP